MYGVPIFVIEKTKIIIEPDLSMRFNEIVGQNTIKQRFIQSVKENRIPHAQLLSGADGAGALPLALAYASYISCLDKGENDSCGQCSSCLKYQKLIHPDLLLTFPVVNSSKYPKAVSDNYLVEFRTAFLSNPYLNLHQWIETIASDNKQGGIFEKESEEITRKLNLKSYESEYKIMIIWMVEKMNTIASNKLLKLLEEPPNQTIFFLIAENTESILTTILSRCQLIKVPLLKTEDIEDALLLKGFTVDQAKNTALLSKGNYNEAIALINEKLENQVFLEQFVKLMRLCYQVNMLELIPFSETLASLGRENQKEFLSYSLNLLRENFALNQKVPSIVSLNSDEKMFANKFHAFIHPGNIEKLQIEFSKAYAHIESNANPKILFLDLALKISVYIRMNP